jgi:TraM recognition site of TraD and TraG
MVRSITQSLNQLERAYGPNHAILDNCHIRIAFSTNDERTAKRVSDALGTATEMRAMKNYAGHRLSPWLGHLMVSRQETSRPLLTPGEVMQLSPNEAIVMVSGVRRVAISDLPSPTRGGRRMRESRTYGVVRVAPCKRVEVCRLGWRPRQSLASSREPSLARRPVTAVAKRRQGGCRPE